MANVKQKSFDQLSLLSVWHVFIFAPMFLIFDRFDFCVYCIAIKNLYINRWNFMIDYVVILEIYALDNLIVVTSTVFLMHTLIFIFFFNFCYRDVMRGVQTVQWHSINWTAQVSNWDLVSILIALCKWISNSPSAKK